MTRHKGKNKKKATPHESPSNGVQDMTKPEEKVPLNEGGDGESTNDDVNGNNKRARVEDDDGWEVVDRHAKKKKKKDRYPSFEYSSRSRLPYKIKIADVRDLVLYIQADGVAPQWIGVAHRTNIRKVVTLMVPGLEDAMFTNNVDFDSFNSSSRIPVQKSENDPSLNLPRPLNRDELSEVLGPFADMFSQLWPLKAPGDDKYARMYSPIQAFLTAPAPKIKEKGGQVPSAKEPNGWKDQRTRITEFLATRAELEENGFLIHPALTGAAHDPSWELPAGWVATRVETPEAGDVPESEIEQGSITAGRQVLAIDCEMCMTGENEYSLTRISILDWAGTTVLDELVKPEKPITDHVTQFSGITAEMLEPVTTSLADIQNRLLDMITPRTILVGHSLDSDLKAIQLVHPFVADTSILFPHPRGPPLKSSLKYLSQKYLSREIQKSEGVNGHNSVEDARACLDLLRQKCEKGKLWGTSDMQGENLFRRLGRAGKSQEQSTSLSSAGIGGGAGGQEFGKTSAAVDWGDVSKGPGAGATHQINCKSDEEVVNGIIRAVNGDHDGLEIRVGGVDFVWGRIRELEAHQGWWSRNRIESAAQEPEQPATDALERAIKASTLASPDLGKSSLEVCLGRVVDYISRIHDSLPPCTALFVLSGSGDPREMNRLQQLQAKFRKEYNSGVKWDQLNVQWSDSEDQALRCAVMHARAGIGFMAIK